MSTPKPPIELEEGCSGIYQDTVYTFQSNAFQSLRLTQGSRWNQLDMGVSVKKSKCVIGAIDGEDALFVVGGVSDDTNYSGLQRYTFKDKQWKTIESINLNIQNRQMHGAAYLNSTSSILVYAGYQDNQAQNSSQTFTISTKSPYVTRSHTSKAPPVMGPILLPWNISHAVMAGGSPANQQVWVFSEEDGWDSVPIVLPTSTPDMTNVQASLIQGDNSSKLLELFDLEASPNKVTTLLVQPANEESPKQKRTPLLSPRLPDSISNKEIDLAQLPKYDDDQAPKDTRKGYSLAQSPSGLVVITGGDGAQESIVLFNQSSNAWLDTKKFFDGTPASSSAAPSSTTSSSASTSSSISTSGSISNTDNESSGGGSNTRVILGSVLGSLFGVAAICILILLLFRRHKSKQQQQNQQPDPGAGFNQGRQMELVDKSRERQGMNHPGNSEESLKIGHVAKAMISNPRIQDERTSPDRGLTAFPNNMARSNGESDSREERTPRDQGWSSYFTTDEYTQNASKNATHDPSESRFTAYTTDSDYTNGSHPHESAEVPPLNIRSSQLPKPDTHFNDNETYLGTSSSEQESWDPVGTSRGTWSQRPPSSIYAESANYPHPGQRVLLSQFPGIPASDRTSAVSPIEQEDRGMRTMASRDFGGMPTDMPTSNVGATRQAPPVSDPRSTREDDMSWLNLGNNR